ncbi:DUF460 domain-containing protein [Halorarum salinum]|uniref:DUF460 domain-containing protein n=1 Tax=Halorarum salinum TaxID=2743089 RepID=A0A7D5L923_9EURY|nr:DUF460 domain-containing protein [Halobaculum salinum]QLG60807.1 DUF460 domain-containing protein [Halobaculum salinum]
MNARTSVLDSLVYGVDVQSGDIRGDAPSYALVAFDGETLERDVVSARKLRRLIDAEGPALVATDNMYELAEDKDALVHFLRALPAETTLVQVTGDERPEPLSRVAARHGVPYGKDPMQEAEAAARLAAANVGYAVRAFADTTTVKVSRGRSTGKGGWSEDRYTRRIHGNVKRRAREVESKLEEAKLEFEMEAKEKYGGYGNAVFTVEAPPGEIPVSRNRSGDTRVEIEQERRDGVEFEPLAKRRDHVIVGIDPGTTTAAAVLDLDGNALDVLSTRTADTAEVIEWLVERGRPVVVAADVHPMPETVEKFRRSFDAAGWAPERDLPVDDKLQRTEDVAYDNDHERDALAAALYAFDDHEDQFERVTRKTPAGVERGEVIARVVAGGQSVEAALRELTDDPDEEEAESGHEPRELTAEEERIRDLEARVERLQDHADGLKDDLGAKDERIAELEEELTETRREERREARRDREVTRLRRENDRLERERDEAEEHAEELEGKLDRLKALWKLDHDNFSDVAGGRDLIPVKVIEQFTKSAIEHADEQFGLAAGDVVLLRDASGAGRATAELLAGTEPRAVLKSGGLSDAADEALFEHEIPVGPAGDVRTQEVDELAVARESDVEDLIDDWHDRAAERERQQTVDMVDEIISEHRASGVE